VQLAYNANVVFRAGNRTKTSRGGGDPPRNGGAERDRWFELTWEGSKVCRYFAFVIAVATLLLAGCATPPQPPIYLADGFFAARSQRIGVAVSEIPQPDTVFPGAGCLLCLAAASLANSSLTGAVNTWKTDELRPLQGELVALLKARGQTVVAIEEPLKLKELPDRDSTQPNYARKDFSALKKAGVERLLVVDFHALGAWRNYSAYIPTGAPRAVFKAEAYVVDLATHRLDWYQMIDLGRPADGSWDEPPKFPGLTNAYFQVLEEGKDRIKKPFMK
jgi:hypothetical protein